MSGHKPLYINVKAYGMDVCKDRNLYTCANLYIYIYIYIYIKFCAFQLFLN
jgi:hypothetical protein